MEKSASKARDLRKLKFAYPAISERIQVKCGDANDELINFCRERNWKKWRAVVFLDPYGNQVSWKTLEEVAKTKAIDLWYLFPAGPGVHRQISDLGVVDPTHTESLDRLMGTHEWATQFVEVEPIPDLFDDRRLRSTKTATVDYITEYMIKRMTALFNCGVLDEWLPLSTKGIKYSLIFASANPAAWKLASRLAKGVLRSTKRGRTK